MPSSGLPPFLVALPLLLAARSAHAFGGAFFAQTDAPRVTEHSVIVSITDTETTLWDEMSFTGSPSSFAWVLPVKGGATIGVSSDALFESLGVATAVRVSSPVACPAACGGGGPDGSVDDGG